MNDSKSDVGTPIYDTLVVEIADPQKVEREFDEFVIRWHVARMSVKSDPAATDVTQRPVD